MGGHLEPRPSWRAEVDSSISARHEASRSSCVPGTGIAWPPGHWTQIGSYNSSCSSGKLWAGECYYEKSTPPLNVSNVLSYRARRVNVYYRGARFDPRGRTRRLSTRIGSGSFASLG